MTTSMSAPQKPFRLSMLIYDTRYRSKTIQIAALIGFFCGLGWLIDNTVTNLSVLGKEPSFRFLTEEAGYKINQKLIEYTAQDTHLRAAFVGLLNTLLVAVLGCFTATVIGVVVGVLRLSKNWLIARLMTIYIEGFRNVPLLLWIVFIMAILVETLPAPSAFRGDSPAASMILGDSVAISNRGIYVPEALFSRSLGDISLFEGTSLQFEVSLDLVAILAVLGLSIWAAKWLGTRADRIQETTGKRPTTWYIQIPLIAAPILSLLFTLGFHLGLPELKGFNFSGGTHIRNSLLALWLALSLYTGAFIAEIVRAGIMAIDHGQTEAAAALGLRPKRIMSLVIMPQALRVIIPPLISNYLNIIKNSSLAIAVGYLDLTGTLIGITLNQTGRELETLLLGMMVYLTISLGISFAMNWYNKHVKLVER
ncbi:amino acid ABC transporter permease [Paracoccus saliphilus]|uniref:ABC transporter permease subunit n=1 Tax=Paracoccus saliphilus TaxID=405559 RepID=A0AA45W2N2_9RHOB|nr:ABC transporter permease subunit [Paracoccus saliphilus]WCR01448.1 ABC transporter permease subunit [Paracoccus saliphilus]SIS69329.1 L-glutamine ABC transporter membrane protein /L-glutamate ABC transporter membrane protein /L-aspartate ABC transporter membrane protein /L-asparagine ABC transporter membrane protein [Paracoccus saliphilus]